VEGKKICATNLPRLVRELHKPMALDQLPDAPLGLEATGQPEGRIFDGFRFARNASALGSTMPNIRKVRSQSSSSELPYVARRKK
jgi:hypothetical protein